MIIAFTLSMPGVSSWNGKWSGESKLYVKTYSFRKKADAQKVLEHVSYSYNFGDGWCASIGVHEVDSREAAKLRKRSDGFYGYEWMVYSIIDHGRILNSQQRKDASE